MVKKQMHETNLLLYHLVNNFRTALFNNYFNQL
jgi:hypothetical protein